MMRCIGETCILPTINDGLRMRKARTVN
jgi:hypothetical protein